MLFRARKLKQLISYQPQSFHKPSAKESLPRSNPHASVRACGAVHIFNNQFPRSAKLACGNNKTPLTWAGQNWSKQFGLSEPVNGGVRAKHPQTQPSTDNYMFFRVANCSVAVWGSIVWRQTHFRESSILLGSRGTQQETNRCGGNVDSHAAKARDQNWAPSFLLDKPKSLPRCCGHEVLCGKVLEALRCFLRKGLHQLKVLLCQT